jgi:hypothetical protein
MAPFKPDQPTLNGRDKIIFSTGMFLALKNWPGQKTKELDIDSTRKEPQNNMRMLFCRKRRRAYYEKSN